MKLFDRSGGTYLNPAPSKTAQHCIDFWSEVEVPDAIVDQVEDAHDRDRTVHVDEIMKDRMQEWTNDWVAQNPEPKRQKDLDARNQRWRQEHEVHRLSVLPDAENVRSWSFVGYNKVPALRAWKMLQHAPKREWWPDEYEAVANYVVEFFTGNLTVAQADGRYHLSRIADATNRIFRSGENVKVLEALDQLDNRLYGIHRELIMHTNALNQN